MIDFDVITGSTPRQPRDKPATLPQPPVLPPAGGAPATAGAPEPSAPKTPPPGR